MEKQIFKMAGMGVLFIALVGCGSSTTTSATTPTAAEASANAAAAVNAAFSSSSSSSLSPASQILDKVAQLFIKNVMAQDGSTCSTVGASPGNVTDSAQGASGTYGSAADPITVDADTDFCQTSAGIANDNSGGLLFATFTLSEATVTCDDESFTMTGEGLWRNRTDLGYYPQIYGSFTFTGNDAATTVNCTIALDGSENVLSATCDDTDTSSATTCSIDAG
jgi:hypothetical protein